MVAIRERIWTGIGWASLILATTVVVWVVLTAVNSPNAVKAQPAAQPKLYVWEYQSPGFNCAVVERDGNITSVNCFPVER
jgi:hypothetical protein